MRVIPKRAAMRSRSINGLAACHYCGHCGRGCDIGAFWNSISDTIPAAAATGRLTLRPDAVVREIVVDNNGKPSGVSFIDRLSKNDYQAKGRVIVLGASALESTRIMLNSVSRHWPDGIANSSGVLGHYLMDNIGGPNVSGLLPQLRDREVVNEDGKASGVDIVPYRNIDSRHPKFIRSYVHEGGSGARAFPSFAKSMSGYGQKFKRTVRSYYTSPIAFGTRGEMLARFENYVEIDKDVTDSWGIPVLKFNCRMSDNEREMAKDAIQNLKALMEALGAENVKVRSRLMPPGFAVHGMGTARMGADPKKKRAGPVQSDSRSEESLRGRRRLFCDFRRIWTDAHDRGAGSAGVRLYRESDEKQAICRNAASHACGAARRRRHETTHSAETGGRRRRGRAGSDRRQAVVRSGSSPLRIQTPLLQRRAERTAGPPHRTDHSGR